MMIVIDRRIYRQTEKQRIEKERVKNEILRHIRRGDEALGNMAPVATIIVIIATTTTAITWVTTIPQQQQQQQVNNHMLDIP